MDCKITIFFIGFVIGPCLFAEPTEDQIVRRVHDHLLIRDVSSAIEEAKNSVYCYPDSLKIHQVYLESLCQKGEEFEALEQFSSFWTKQGDEKNRRLVSEWLAWGTLRSGENSPLFLVRLYSLLGTALTQDAKALPLLLKEMRGSNAFLRSLAVRLSMNYGDQPLQKELLRLLQEEKVWFVRLEVMRAVGALKIKEARGYLQNILVSQKTLAEEKAAAILALVNTYDQIDKKELHLLLQSNRAGLRHLGSEIMAHLECKEEAEELLPLLMDASPDVRISAMNTLGLLQVKEIHSQPTVSYLKENLSHTTPSISITAGWLAAVLGQAEGKAILKGWLESPRLETRRLACAAVAVLGPFGLDLLVDRIQKEEDLYAQVNLALGLIGQRKELAKALDVLFLALQEPKKELWMWDAEENPLFRTLNKSTVRHMDQIPRYPQVVDHLTRLELFSILSMLKYPKALEAVKSFLKKQDFGVTGAAAAILLQEGDDASIFHVQELLQDSDEQVRIQAALLLGVLGRDPLAIDTLIASYAGAGRDLKIHILEALGYIGDPKAIPFLIEVLKEPFQGLRVVSASALIQCLYH